MEIRLLEENRIFYDETWKQYSKKLYFQESRSHFKKWVWWCAFFINPTFKKDKIKYRTSLNNNIFFRRFYFFMDIIMRLRTKDVLITAFGSTWSRVTNGKCDTSTEKTCQSIWWHKGMETKRNFLNHFLTPPFCQRIRTKTNNHTWCKLIKKQQVVMKLMNIVLNWDKRNNQRTIDKSFFGKDWIRITGWLAVLPKVLAC